jgi:hypothetical protein
MQEEELMRRRPEPAVTLTSEQFDAMYRMIFDQLHKYMDDEISRKVDAAVRGEYMRTRQDAAFVAIRDAVKAEVLRSVRIDVRIADAGNMEGL